MVRFIIVRHGYSKGNKEKKFTGQLDVPLADAGLIQAESVRNYISEKYKVDSIVSSDLKRAYDTVKPLADALGLEIVKSRALREVDVGLWEGVEIEKVKNNYPREFEAYKNTPGLFDFPNGESYEKTQKRAVEFLKEASKESQGKNVLISTHGGVIRVLRAFWTDTPLSEIQKIEHVPNASITTVVYENEVFVPEITGFTGHLAEKITEEGIK